MKTKKKIFLIFVAYVIIQIAALYIVNKSLISTFITYGTLFLIGLIIPYLIFKKKLETKKNDKIKK